MCLIITGFESRKKAREFYKTPLIAKKDILVYKILQKYNNHSPYYYMKYEKGFLYYQDGKRQFSSYIMPLVFSWNLEINQGLHSYKNKKVAEDCLFSVFTDPSYKIVEMIVPKGSKYFENDGEIVSNQLLYI